MQYLIGSDAGGWQIVFEGGKVVIKHVPGWNPEQIAEVSAAVGIMRQAMAIKEPGVRERVVEAVASFAEKQLPHQAQGENTIIIIGG